MMKSRSFNFFCLGVFLLGGVFGATVSHAVVATQSKVNDDFSFGLFYNISKPKENQVFSPFGISTALAMVAAGADKNTLAEMRKVLSLAPDFSQEYRNRIAQAKPSPAVQLEVANQLWSKKGGEYHKEYLKELQDNFQAKLVDLDFKTKPEPFRLQINQWVEEKTQHKIQNLLPAGSITQDTDLVITNAVYFKGA